MKKGWKTYEKLFTSTFYLSAFTFGGGYVIIPLMKKKFVDDLDWIDETEMLNLAAIAQSAPGAVAVNASILLGYRIAGIKGAMITVLGTVLPPLIILSVISIGYAAFRDNVVVNAVLKAMQSAVAAVICDVVWTMGSGVLKEKQVIPTIVMFGAFIANYFFGVNVIVIVLACGALGVLQMVIDHYLHKEEPMEKDETKEDAEL
ncbi:chromate transporter [Absiella sp. AM54-8XD]|jgi:chromate transporter|uniref:Chromate transporter n=2 Tax=Amedibacillus TaxID=2749846 RepID=A0A7G9GPS2_9FIRM|nr:MULTISPECIES: chromate transporter [Bacillota]QNM12804.1 chromate transporter [[Eubacterium] hominis]MCH4286683.1 chromate transporter [Amedibacillus hominis]RGB58234.1 chromate transporter [Absiella sp. AM22-9]RGB60007.1 chromate transporter [Absiella sp. AM10-20]RGC26593.1 chromate transporter [Absiella sp. AM54-8XD]